MVVSGVDNKNGAITQPVPFDPEIRRYFPNRDFPSYRYVPRLTPHPVKDPDGHSYRTTSEEVKMLKSKLLLMVNCDLSNKESVEAACNKLKQEVQNWDVLV